jgi:integrase
VLYPPIASELYTASARRQAFCRRYRARPAVISVFCSSKRHPLFWPSDRNTKKFPSETAVLMGDIVTVLVDTGMRPEENSRLRWECMSWSNGQCGTLQVTHGKAAAARRMPPMSPRVRALLERRWEAAKMPLEGWVWATATASGQRRAFHGESWDSGLASRVRCLSGEK